MHLCLELNYNFLKGRGHFNAPRVFPSLCVELVVWLHEEEIVNG